MAFLLMHKETRDIIQATQIKERIDELFLRTGLPEQDFEILEVKITYSLIKEILDEYSGTRVKINELAKMLETGESALTSQKRIKSSPVISQEEIKGSCGKILHDKRAKSNVHLSNAISNLYQAFKENRPNLSEYIGKFMDELKRAEDREEDER